LGANERVETVERLVQHQNGRVMADRLGQLDALAHALAVAGDGALSRLTQADAVDRLHSQFTGLRMAQAEEAQVGINKLVACQAARERVVLRTVADVAKELFGLAWRES